MLKDVRDTEIDKEYPEYFDFLLTSPPYATALPYIDTQRLSSVWLNLINSNDIRNYEKLLIGTRELSKTDLLKNNEILHNGNTLPKQVKDICLYLESRLSDEDGFRRQAFPYLLHSYFMDMYKSFKNLFSVIKRDGYYCLIVGKNRSRIGNKDTMIDTPYYLSLIAESIGYMVKELIPLETYQRYDVHLKNSIDQETLIVLRKTYG